MSIVAIAYHSGYGRTARQAEAVGRGAPSLYGVTAELIKVQQVDQRWMALEKADAIIFGSPA
jgi:NAD(P)H dehydrogenase (quinone)